MEASGLQRIYELKLDGMNLVPAGGWPVRPCEPLDTPIRMSVHEDVIESDRLA